MYFSIHSLYPPAVLPFWRNGPRRKRSTRRGLPVLAATPSRLPTCSAVPRPVPIPAYRPRRPVRCGGNARRSPNLLHHPECGSNSSLPAPVTGPFWRQLPAGSNLLRCPEAGSSTLTICADFPFVRKRSRRFRHVGATEKHSQLTPSGSLPGLPGVLGAYREPTGSLPGAYRGPTGGHQYSDTNGERG